MQKDVNSSALCDRFVFDSIVDDRERVIAKSFSSAVKSKDDQLHNHWECLFKFRLHLNYTIHVIIYSLSAELK